MITPLQTAGMATAAALVAFAGGLAAERYMLSATPPLPIFAPAFAPPADAAIPDDALGAQIRLGRAVFTDTGHAAPDLVGNGLHCSNCHLDAGRRPQAAPLWAALGLFPQYRAKNGHVNTFAERVRECFLYSLNGRMPAYDDPRLVAVESYAAFLARGAPIGVRLPGQGFAKLAPPPQPPDRVRGKAVFTQECARCHGDDGAGRSVGADTAVPPLWGPRAYNWGAGMGDIPNAAGFVRVNMPQDAPGRLTDQQAWDVAAYIDGKPRPQDPRWAGSPAETRRKFHNGPQSLYGTVADGVLLGGDGPPKAAKGRQGAVTAAPLPR